MQEFQENIYFCFIDYAKAFDCVDHNKLWNILKEMGIPDHLTCLLRNLYAGQEARVRTGHGTDWFQTGKGVRQGCILSPCLFNLYICSRISRGTPEARSRLCVCRASFLMTFVMGGVPHWLPAVIEFQWSYSTHPRKGKRQASLAT